MITDRRRPVILTADCELNRSHLHRLYHLFKVCSTLLSIPLSRSNPVLVEPGKRHPCFRSATGGDFHRHEIQALLD